VLEATVVSLVEVSSVELGVLSVLLDAVRIEVEFEGTTTRVLAEMLVDETGTAGVVEATEVGATDEGVSELATTVLDADSLLPGMTGIVADEDEG